jgi:hypothetical protein
VLPDEQHRGGEHNELARAEALGCDVKEVTRVVDRIAQCRIPRWSSHPCAPVVIDNELRVEEDRPVRFEAEADVRLPPDCCANIHRQIETDAPEGLDPEGDVPARQMIDLIGAHLA